MWNKDKYKILIDSEIETESFFDNQEDFEFLKDKKLLEQKNIGFSVKFVGEIITPNTKYFSLPKNFKRENSSKTIPLFQAILKQYKNEKKDGKVIVLNKTFIPKQGDTFDSDEYYYKELKKCFLDFVAYEFIYPLKTVTVHSATPVKGGKLDVLKSVENRKRFGSGMTYRTKDISDNPDWQLDKIYYNTLFILSQKYGTQSDREEINQMKEDLNYEGYDIKDPNEEQIQELEDYEKTLEMIYKSDVNPVHYHIKDTLIEYYSKLKLGESSYSINIIYTEYFNLVWEDLLRNALFHDTEFEMTLNNKFNKSEIITKWLSDEQIDQLTKDGKKLTFSEEYPNLVSWKGRDLKPDIFSQYKSGYYTYRFIGDAKYYSSIEKDFSKELSDYNEAMNDRFPMCIFVCSDRTTVNRKRELGQKELIIFELNAEDALASGLERKMGKTNTILMEKVLGLIYKYTRRRGNFRKQE